jgi:para-aminobenzoate synthetase/4-amino-4-deoxychorismate lyase
MKTNPLSVCDVEDILSQSSAHPFVFLETARFDSRNYRSFIFNALEDVLIFNLKDDVKSFFHKMETHLKRGAWLAGFFSYEFGYLLEDKLLPLLPESMPEPLFWLGVFGRPRVINHTEHLPSRCEEIALSHYSIENVRPNISEGEYISSIQRIKKFIEAGDTYQVNYTFQLTFDLEGDPKDLYLDLRRAQPTSYMAYIDTSNERILSLSPELFFAINGKRITARPMKGTISRGKYLDDDAVQEGRLRNSQKDKAENVMIVDLLRNDLGRVAEKGTVDVKELFSIEKYRTVFQMTSTVDALLRKNACLEEIVRSLFPCGSVTGAPKVRTMQIIREMENALRGVYCGAIGYFSPHHDACFNVAIRTIQIDGSNRARLGVGGGVVYDSHEWKEYREALLKAHFLTKKEPAISLIETMRWSGNEGYYLLDFHLERLRNSCQFFEIPFHPEEIQEKLSELTKDLKSDITYRVRLLISRNGSASLDYSPLDELRPPVPVKLSNIRVSPDDIFLYHKTTERDLYTGEREKALRHGFWEVIFMNQRDELTEGSITNIFVMKDGLLHTPPVECGLLRGVLREYLIRNGEVKEKILHMEDLNQADKLYIGNSVRGLIEAEALLTDFRTQSERVDR